jgi:septal ring factor EnvC (AmiA/AmiB activator)
VKEKVNQLFKDKLILVMLVLGLLTLVAAAGAVTIRKGGKSAEESPYLEIRESEGVIAESEQEDYLAVGDSNAEESLAERTSQTEAAKAETDHARPFNEDLAAPEEYAAENPIYMPVEEAGAAANESLVLNFSEGDRLLWPVSGNVILSYTMDTTTWFPTLEQYKCNPASVIQSDVSTPVAAPADARVLELGMNEEIGAYVRLDFGNGYTAVCGQLKEIPVVENEYLHKGDTIGYIAEPTKYYAVEGNNLYFELLQDGQPIDALDYLE